MFLGRLRQQRKLMGKVRKPTVPTVPVVTSETTAPIVIATTQLEDKYKGLSNLLGRYFWTYFPGLETKYLAGIKQENNNFWFYVNKDSQNVILRELAPTIKEAVQKFFAMLKDQNELARFNSSFAERERVEQKPISKPIAAPKHMTREQLKQQQIGKRQAIKRLEKQKPGFRPEGPIASSRQIDEAQIPFQSRDEMTYSGELF